MNKPPIIMYPTIANPDAIDNVPELRGELHRANTTILKLADQLHALSCVTQEISERLSRMAFAHRAGKQDAVKRELDDIVARYVKVTQKPQGGLH